MKVIAVSNFDDDQIDDILVCEAESKYWAGSIAKSLNKTSGGDRSPHFFKVVDDNYVLYKWEP